MKNEEKGILFEESFQRSLKERFYFPDCDSDGSRRIFFDNSGGSLRLISALEAKADLERYPDCPERSHERALWLKDYVNEGTMDVLSTVFSARGGSLITELTASQAMFHLVGLILENDSGTNAVVSALEHPSAFDAVEYYCKKTGKQMRVVYPNKETGSIEPKEVAKLIDGDTSLLSVTSASNVTGAVTDIASIVECARKIKPELYVISDAVQHAPHAALDVDALGLDGANFAPYKFFGVRGCGFAYVSDRVASLPHRKLIAKDEKEFALGTSAPGNFAAMTAVIDYVCEIGAHFMGSAGRRELYREGMRRIKLQERALLHRLLEGNDDVAGLRSIEGVSVYADGLDIAHRDLIVAMGINGVDASVAVEEYARRGIIVCERTKTSMYSKRIVTALGVDDVIRVSPLHCHSTDDIDEFLYATQKIAAAHRP